ncbi:MAG TPA: DUF3500 domain-containing protein [Candidatus Latescibacteria bacterium]|jgi:hypothetical protein|nr:DUF3500 domain-containing protein [Candidatus Latescibacterota bacterium]HJP34247.1 DUF3500 domain-containing protein [Candidatus Latescibacterota bacterium]
MTTAADVARQMAAAARTLLEALDDTQKARIGIDFDEATERTNWHYIPRERAGLPLKEMNPNQQQLALALIATGLSTTSTRQAQTIMGLESVLAGIEGPGRRFPRDPELYYVTLFGDVGADTVWGWRFEGHHISLNNTIVNGTELSSAPLFFGSNPAHVRHGEQVGVRALKDEEEVARDLLSQLDGEQQGIAIIAAEAPADILTTSVVRVSDEAPAAGLPAAEMSAGQQQQLEALVRVYIERLPEALAAAELARLRQADLAAAHFAWAGAAERGGPHYYRVQSTTFLAEYDNTQNDANHIHAVWRDLTNDFGHDLLRRHYRQSH